ncbi:hypothetical protein BJ170DRAFT_685380 [Xylariales sp. AK1849]|nr:hypothetical protein BJ170DRAFT_685380 [Xylariales sp. AK1849]
MAPIPAASRYTYKIVPSTTPIPLRGSNLPPSFYLPSSALDKKDGFLHVSTSLQVPGTLKRFFPTSASTRDSIYLFKVSYEGLQNRSDISVKWENSGGQAGEPWKDERFFPHIYLNADAGARGLSGDGLAAFAGEEVKEDGIVVPQSVVEVVSEIGEEGWDGVLGRVKEWLI